MCLYIWNIYIDIFQILIFFLQDSLSISLSNIEKSERNFFKAKCSAETLSMPLPSFTF